MADVFHREYLVRLPLPLAQLYSRAYNAKDARGRHDNAFYLFEALTKLAAAPLVEAYLQEVERGAARAAGVDRTMAALALPSLGQWVGMFRELARHFGQRPDAAVHPLGHLWNQIDDRRRDLPAIIALFQRIKNGPDGQPAGDQSCSLLELFDALVQYRNGVFGHGAGRFDSFYEREMGPLLFPALNELLRSDVLRLLGPQGTRLVYLTELRTLDENRRELGLRELVGLNAERMDPIVLTAEQAESVLPHRVAVLWPGRKTPLALDPLLAYREHEQGEEVLFLNRDRNGRQVELLSYTTGRTERDKTLAPAMARLLSRVAGREVSEDDLAQFGEETLAETPSFERLLPPERPQGRIVGEYEILAEIGRGGMGVVYLARQLSLGRLVALKMLPADLAGDELALGRFRREMRALGSCEHPNIVKVLSSGALADGQLYYTMEYVPGTDLESVWRELSGSRRTADISDMSGTVWARAVITASRKQRESTERRATGEPTEASGGDATKVGKHVEGSAVPHVALAGANLPLPPLPEMPAADGDPGGYARHVARLIRDVASAVQAVHDQHIVHRDVKPSNLMLTADGSRVVLMDFGLAKGKSLALTTAGSGFLGTLRYAAPEQLASARVQVDHRADIRALGVTLWEMLARRRAFEEAQDEQQLASWVLNKDLPRLRTIDRSIDRDLEAIVARAGERDVESRIQSARELAEYLDLHLHDKPLPIRPPGVRELSWRWVRAHKALVATAATSLAAVLLVCIIAFVLVAQSWKERWEVIKDLDKAKEQLVTVNSERDQVKDQLIQMNEQVRAVQQELTAANALKDEAVAGQKEALLATQQYEAQLHELESQVELKEERAKELEGEVHRNLYLLYNTRILAAHQSLKAGEWAKGLDELHDATSLASGDGFATDEPIVSPGWELRYLAGVARARVVDLRGLEGQINSVAVSPDGRLVAAGASDGRVLAWDAVTGQVAPAWRHQSRASLEIGLRYDAAGGKLMVAGYQPFAQERDKLPPPDSEIVAVSDSSGTMLPLGDLSPREITELLEGEVGEEITVLVDLGDGGQPVAYTLAFRQNDPVRHSGAVSCVRFSPDGRWLATSSWDDVVLVRDVDRPGDERYYFSKFGGSVPCIAFQPHGSLLAIVGGDNQIRLYDLTTGLSTLTLSGHEGAIHSVEFHPDGTQLASTGEDGTLRIWDPTTGETIRQFSEPDARFGSLAYSPDGQKLLAIDNHFHAHVWDLSRGMKDRASKLDYMTAWAMDWEPAGTRVAVGTIDGNVIVYDTAQGFEKPLGSLRVHTAIVRAVAFSPDGRYVASAGSDGAVRITDVELDRQTDYHLARTFESKASGQRTIAFAPDGRRILIASRTRLEVHDAATARVLPSLGGDFRQFNGQMRGIAWTPDWGRIAFGTQEGTLRVVDGATGSLISQFPTEAELRHAGEIDAVAIDERGTLIASADKGRTIKVWNADTGQLLHSLDAAGSSRANALVFNHAADVLVSIYGRTMQLWDLNTGQSIRVVTENDPYCAAFHPSDETLATGGFNGEIVVWDLTTNLQLQQLRGHRGPVMAVAWNADASRLVSSGGDGAVIVWEPQSGQALVTLSSGEEAGAGGNPVSAAAFSPDGLRLASVFGDGTRFSLWDAATLTHEPADGDWYALFVRGCVQIDYGHWRQAVADLDRAIDLGADDALAWRNRGLAHGGLREFDAALADIDAALVQRPQDGSIHLCRHYVRIAAEGDAAANDDEATDGDEADHGDAPDHGDAAADDDYANADAHSFGALSVTGNHVWGRRRPSRAGSDDDWEGVAVFLTSTILKQDNPAWRLHRACGLALAAAGRYEQAEAQFRLAAEAHAGDWRSWHGLARALAERPSSRRDWPAAIDACSRAIELKADSWQLWYLRGTCRRYAEQWAEASADLEKAVQLHGEVWGPLLERGYVLAQLSDAEGAAAAMAKAKTLAEAGEGFDDVLGDIALAYRQMDSLYWDRGNSPAALAARVEQVALYRRQWQDKQDDASKQALVAALGNVSFYYLFNSAPDKALEAAQEALELDPSQHWIRTNESHAHLFLGRLETARDIVLKYKDEKVNDQQTFAQAMHDDYRQFRERGITHPDMEKIEKLLAP